MRLLSGRFDEHVTEVDEKELRELRIASARRMDRWTEVMETDLVPRGPYLVHAQSDQLFTVYGGPIFGKGSPTILFQDYAPMYWYLDREGYIVVLERRPGLWSDIVARQARRRTA